MENERWFTIEDIIRILNGEQVAFYQESDKKINVNEETIKNVARYLLNSKNIHELDSYQPRVEFVKGKRGRPQKVYNVCLVDDIIDHFATKKHEGPDYKRVNDFTSNIKKRLASIENVDCLNYLEKEEIKQFIFSNSFTGASAMEFSIRKHSCANFEKCMFEKELGYYAEVLVSLSPKNGEEEYEKIISNIKDPNSMDPVLNLFPNRDKLLKMNEETMMIGFRHKQKDIYERIIEIVGYNGMDGKELELTGCAIKLEFVYQLSDTIYRYNRKAVKFIQEQNKWANMYIEEMEDYKRAIGVKKDLINGLIKQRLSS